MRILRYSQGPVTVEPTIAGRGLYFTRKPDGVWWRLRLRRRRCPPASFWAPPELPPPVEVREPLRSWPARRGWRAPLGVAAALWRVIQPAAAIASEHSADRPGER